jgi:hypothetical protein
MRVEIFDALAITRSAQLPPAQLKKPTDRCLQVEPRKFKDGIPLAPVRARDRARGFKTLLAVIHHSELNAYFGDGDAVARLDLAILLYNSFFMACMFLILGIHVAVSRGAIQQTS